MPQDGAEKRMERTPRCRQERACEAVGALPQEIPATGASSLTYLGSRVALVVGLGTITLLASSCALPGSGGKHSGSTNQTSLIAWPGPCRGLAMPQTVTVQREPTSDARATGFPLKNLSPFKRSIRDPLVTEHLMASACSTSPVSCNFITTLQSTVLNGYIVTFFHEQRRVATLVGTPSLPCGTLFLIKGSKGPRSSEEGAPFIVSYPGWIDLHGHARSFFADLAAALKVPLASLTS